MGGSYKTLESKEKSSFRASEALHRMVHRAKRDPESSLAEGGIQAILSRLGGTAFAGMTEEVTFARTSWNIEIMGIVKF